MVEVVRAAFRTSTEAHRGPRPPERLARARQVLAADTLLTFAWELAADLGGDPGAEARARLDAFVGAGGFLGRLAEGDPPPDPEAEAARFADALREALRAG